MIVGYFPGWSTGYVEEYMGSLRKDGQRRKAVAKLEFDLQMLATTWPRPQFVAVKSLKGHEPLYELVREYQGMAYRIFFCVQGQEIWLLHAIEKKQQKTPIGDLSLAYHRMRKVFCGNVRRI